jgi:hypothetical protein
MSSYSTIQDHRSMTFDELRNTYYSEAIKKAVDKESVVLDLGAGLGLHGSIAACSGAQKVYLVEPAAIVDVAKQLVIVNDLSGRVDCFTGKIEEIELPEKVDVIISVFTGNFLLTEDLLPSLFYARDKYLNPGGILIPDRATMDVVPVCAPEYYAEHIDCWNNSLHGVDFDLVRGFTVNSIYYDDPENREVEFLSEPVELHELDFMTAKEASCRSRTQVEINEEGLCHGWLGWFRMHLGDKWLSTSPLEKQTHWSQVFLPLSEPISVKKGDIVSFELIRPEFGEWTWTVGYGDKCQRQSTFLSELISPEVLQRKADTYKPHLSLKGKVTREILSRLDGKDSTAEIVEYVMAEHGNLFPHRKQIERFVKDIVERYSS